MPNAVTQFEIGEVVVELLIGDITQIPVYAIANAANSHLAGGGGVDGAIHRRGGPEIMRELDAIRARIGHCSTGSAVVTGAGHLPAKYVLHAVGPIYRGGNSNEAELLASCYRTCLELARQCEAVSISFPSISTGVYGYPVAEAARICLETIAASLNEKPGPIRNVKLVQFGPSDHAIYSRAASNLLRSGS